jgi:hypothetical protein
MTLLAGREWSQTLLSNPLGTAIRGGWRGVRIWHDADYARQGYLRTPKPFSRLIINSSEGRSR